VACSDSGVGSVFRPGRCRQHLDPQHPNPRRRSNVRCCWVWPSWCSDPVGGSVVQYGRWRLGLAWAVQGASGLAVAECLLGQGRSLSSQLLWEGNGSGVPTSLEIFEFFFLRWRVNMLLVGRKPLFYAMTWQKGLSCVFGGRDQARKVPDLDTTHR
jgi:hypothetical protein